MCEAKRMSPCSDDRIISSGPADTACILIPLSFEAFFLTSAANLTLAPAAPFLCTSAHLSQRFYLKITSNTQDKPT